MRSPPTVLVGGAENAVSAARALRARGVRVVAVAEDRAPVHRSRGVIPARVGERVDEASLEAWFAAHGARHEGSVLIPLSDHALQFVVQRHAALGAAFRVARLDPEVVAAMLDKRRTVELAEAAGVPAPRQWSAESADDLDRFVDEIVFPVVVKPRRTYELIRLMARKFLWAHDRDELHEAMQVLSRIEGGFSVNEFVPGPDSQLSSYYALRDQGRVLCEFTKRIERRYPTNEGGATLHRMEQKDEAMRLGRAFFAHIGLEGLGNVEFKFDPRDGRTKLIECNHRLTAATELVQRSGIDIVGAVYDQALGRPTTASSSFDERWFWYPVRDLQSARSQSARAMLDWCTVPLRRPVLPFFRLDDPVPAWVHARNGAQAFLRRRRGA
jgi:D-aspartate ligase